MHNEQNQLKRGVVMSDLHLFARRSDAAARLAAMRAELNRADLLVLNGDTFDFRWSTLGDEKTTVAAAWQWLEQLGADLPQCQVHFILGNHDWLAGFREGLARLAANQPRLHWHEYWLRLGPALFLHGDCTETMMDANRLHRYRQSWNQDGQRGGLLTAAYLCADRLGVTQFSYHCHFPRMKTIRRLAHYLDRTCPDWRGQVRDCYFGHTHLPYSNIAHDGIHYHNTGSAIRGMEFNPIWFEIQGDL